MLLLSNSPLFFFSSMVFLIDFPLFFDSEHTIFFFSHFTGLVFHFELGFGLSQQLFFLMLLLHLADHFLLFILETWNLLVLLIHLIFQVWNLVFELCFISTAVLTLLIFYSHLLTHIFCDLMCFHKHVLFSQNLIRQLLRLTLIIFLDFLNLTIDSLKMFTFNFSEKFLFELGDEFWFYFFFCLFS